ncbi:hypothetical protein [Oryzomicrobium sp.]|uniref:hypothetical protein n=1 Tax=Oryzomicrobium sp. TaxID=1911578 RepID=UPI002FE06392
MPDPTADASRLAAILEWLSLPPLPDATADLAALDQQRAALRPLALTGQERLQALNRLAARTMVAINGAQSQLSDQPLPLPRKLRGLTRALLDLSAALADDFDALLASPGTAGQLAPQRAQIRHRTLLLRRLHLEIAGLAGTPPHPDAWSGLHGAFTAAEREGLADGSPSRGERSARLEYAHALLLGLVPAGALGAGAYALARRIGAALAEELEFLPGPDGGHRGLFWIEPGRDIPPVALARRPPPPDTPARWVAGDRAARRLVQLAASGQAERLGLPAAHGVALLQQHQPTLDKLAGLWGKPAKRRFPRRRQNYRARLCIGLPAVWALLAGRLPEDDETRFSRWMVTNESPDGYAAMHLSGPTDPVRPGEVVAIQGEKSPQWHVALVRWVISENPEHLELGLQLAAPRAQAARVGDPAQGAAGETPALFLPGMPGVRPAPALIVPVGTVDEDTPRLAVTIESRDGATAETLEAQPTSRLESTASVCLLQLATMTAAH